jgi:DNA-binding response OmpR family regulator/drug/metabolite transporter (DMT)-like permease
MSAPERVLIVDDQGLSRRKMAMAVKHLGREWIEADSGEAALAILQDNDVDLILLDIMMPGMDGFAVLEALRADKRLAVIPVLVISGMDGEMESVARAIELGATDFLPKDFNPVLFKARLESCIERKRLRAIELDHLAQMDRLAAAAQIMESGRFHPGNLQLEGVAKRPDAVGRLAGIFVEMAHQVYDRELALQRNIRTLKGGVLLLLQGILWGLVVPLSVLIYRTNELSLGVTFWSNLVAGVFCCAWALASRKSMRVNRQEFMFILAWACIFGLSSIVLFEAAGRVSGIALSIIIAMQGFAVFAIAAAMRIEAPSLMRFAGLGLGLTGVLALLFARDSVTAGDDVTWLLIAALIPLLYGAIDILIAVKHPPKLDPIVSSGLVLLLSAVLVLPLALLRGHFFVLGAVPSWTDALIALTGLCVGICTVLYIRLIAMAGAVFGSQSAYAITVAGIAWSVLLLGEALTLWTGVALFLIVLGLALVGPKSEAGNIDVEFRRRARR